VTPTLLAVVALAGGLGAAARFFLSRQIVHLAAVRRPRPEGRIRHLPALGTAAVNLLGALGAGFLLGISADGGYSGASTVLGVGFLGAFTTFSAWMAEVVDLWATRHRAAALLHLLGLLSAGLLLAFLGFSIAQLG
jgi:CrcB protein